MPKKCEEKENVKKQKIDDTNAVESDETEVNQDITSDGSEEDSSTSTETLENSNSEESFEIDYNIKELLQDDIDQIVIMNKTTHLFEDILNACQHIIENCIAAKSDDYILCYAGLLKISLLKNYMPKRIKKLLKDYNDHEILLYNKYGNTPLEVIIDTLEKITIKDEVVFISKCKRLEKKDLNMMADEFKEYSLTDIEYFPVNSEEFFFVDNNVYCKSFCCNDVFYKLFLIDATNMKRFIELLKKEKQSDK